MTRKITTYLLAGCLVAALGWCPLIALAQDEQPQDAATVPADVPAAQPQSQAPGDDEPVTDEPEQPAEPPIPLVGWLELSETLPEAPPPFAFVAPEEVGPTLSDVIDQLDTVASDDRYIGVVVFLDRPMLTLSQIDAISDALDAVRAEGKHVMAFAEQYTLGTYLLACSADTILLQRKGEVWMFGFGVEEIYLVGLLDKLGMQADLVQVGEFKGAEEPWTRTGPSDAWNQNIDALLNDLYGQVVGRIAERRGMSDDEVEQVFADSLLMSDTDYVQRRVIDQLTDRDLIEATELAYGDEFEWDETMGGPGDTARVDNPFAMFRMLFQEPKTQVRRQSIALINAAGPIHSGESAYGEGLFGGENIGSQTMVEVLGDVRDNDLIKGAVIRLDSPGGSAIASEMIWQAIREVGETKPVFVSVGSMAASGGYYIACGADEVFVVPHSIVGSIGVVGGKIILGGLYDKIGVAVHRRSRGPLADMFNSVTVFTPQQRTVLEAALNRIYAQFTQRILLGRGNRIGDIDAVARGRLFTGKQAVQNGLADRIGDLDDALTAMAEQLDLEPGTYDVVTMPPPMSLAEFLEKTFDLRSRPVAVQVGMIEAARSVLGPDVWRSARSVLNGLMLLRHEPVLVLLPTVIVIR